MVPLALLLLPLAGPPPAGAPAAAEFAEDIGPSVIDVSSYPKEHQETYHDIFLPAYALIRGGPARAINSPLIEIDAAGEKALRRAQPELFADARLARVTPDGWRGEVFRVKNRPPCCGACPILTQQAARALWRFFVYDSLRRKTGPAAADWLAHRRRLIRLFEEAREGRS